jgi:hypothetical protein
VTAAEVAVDCGVPDGFHRLEPDPPQRRLAGLRVLLDGLPPAPGGRAGAVLADYERALALLREQRLLFCALGLHQDAGGRLRSSVLALAAHPLAGSAPGPVLSALLTRVAADASAVGVTLLELPAGPALLWERQAAGPVWTGTVALGCAAHDRLALLQLASAATDLAADYREVLLATAHTLAFHRPAALAPSRIADALG